MSREPFDMIWMRPVRGTGWYCWGFPTPATHNAKKMHVTLWIFPCSCDLKGCLGVNFRPYLQHSVHKYLRLSQTDFTTIWNFVKPFISLILSCYCPVVGLMCWFYLWHVSTWLLEVGNPPQSSWELQLCHRYNLDCWAAPRNAAALRNKKMRLT